MDIPLSQPYIETHKAVWRVGVAIKVNWQFHTPTQQLLRTRLSPTSKVILDLPAIDDLINIASRWAHFQIIDQCLILTKLIIIGKSKLHLDRILAQNNHIPTTWQHLKCGYWLVKHSIDFLVWPIRAQEADTPGLRFFQIVSKWLPKVSLTLENTQIWQYSAKSNKFNIAYYIQSSGES